MSIVILGIIGVFIQIYLKIDEEPIQEEVKQDIKAGHDVSLNDPRTIKWSKNIFMLNKTLLIYFSSVKFIYNFTNCNQ